MLFCLVLVAVAPGSDVEANAPVTLHKGAEVHAHRVIARIAPGAMATDPLGPLRHLPAGVEATYASPSGLLVLEWEPPLATSRAATTPAGGNASAALLASRLGELRASGLYAFVEPDHLLTTSLVPTEPRFADGTLWALRNLGQDGGVAGVDIDAVRAWDVSTGSTSVIVAVIDSGIRHTHADLSTQLWRNPGEIPANGIDDDGNGYVDDVFGINAITRTGDPFDDQGHGTHVAGTIGAAADGGGAHVGVAWQVRLMALKFISAQGSGFTSDAIRCIDYAVANGARILNASWGGDRPSAALEAAIQAARAAGVLFVAAAGNEARDTDSLPAYPAAYPLENVVSVAAIDRRGDLSRFSNFGRVSVDLAAPGDSIFSTFAGSDTDYAIASGTSMAAPHVSGVAALILAHRPSISLVDLRNRLLLTTTPDGRLAGRTVTGGRLNAHRALVAEPTGTLLAEPAPAAGAVLYHGRATTFRLRVGDLTAVLGATVQLSLDGGPPATLRDDGVAPDATVDDGDYAVELAAPAGGSAVAARFTISAPGKTPAVLDLAYVLRAPPPNDTFAAAAALSGVSSTIEATNAGAGREAGEPRITGQDGGASVWWRWTAPSRLRVTFSTAGSGFDTLLGVYSGPGLGALVTVGENDDASPATLTSAVTFEAQAGTTYHIAIDGVGGAAGPLRLSLTAAPPPPNDRFADRAVLSGDGFTVTGNPANASLEPGEPRHPVGAPGTDGSVWWSWTAPASGTAVLDSTGEGIHAVHLYRGDDLAALARVPGRRDDIPLGRATRRTFAARAGTTYQIALVGSQAVDSGPIVLRLATGPGPSNDHFEARTVVSGAEFAVAGSNLAATREDGEPEHVPESGGASVWWSWTAPASGTVSLDTAGSDFDTQLAVHTGASVAALSLVAANDDAFTGERSSRVTFSATGGTTYAIAVDGALAATGAIALRLALGDAPRNDAFADRLPLSGERGAFRGTTTGATREAGEPAHHGSASQGSVWWTWVAPRSGVLVLRSVAGPDRIAVYTGESLGTLVARTPPGAGFGNPRGLYRVSVTAGLAHHIVVTADGGGPLVVEYELFEARPNDAFADRGILTGEQLVVTGDLSLATLEPGEPFPDGSTPSGTLWFTWTAPDDGVLRWTSLSGSASLATYTGASLAALGPVPDQRGRHPAGLPAHVTVRGGVAYHLAFDSGPAAPAPFEARLEFARHPPNDLPVQAFALEGRSAAASGTTRGARPETTSGVQGTVWWTWTAPASGVVDLELSNAGEPLLVDLGTVFNNALNAVSSRLSGLRSRALVTAGQAYAVRVGGEPAPWTPFALSLSLVDPPPNDAFADRLPLVGRRVEATGTTVGATGESGEVGVSRFALAATASVWWSWTAPETGRARFSTLGGARPVVLRVFTGDTLGGLAPVADNAALDPFTQSRPAFVASQVEAGRTYAIVLQRAGEHEGAVRLEIGMIEPASNDGFATRILLDPADPRAFGTVLGATVEPGEPLLRSGLGLSGSVWFSWTAPSTGSAYVIFTERAPNTALEVFQGPALEALTPVPTVGSGAFAAVAGETYQFRIHSPAGREGGDFAFSVDVVPGPVNDRFADRIRIVDTDAVQAGTTLHATVEPGEPAASVASARGTVWWSWTAPAAAWVTIVPLEADGPTFAVHRGDAPAALVKLAESAPGTPNPLAAFRSEAGVAYQISASSERVGVFSWRLSLAALAPNDRFADRTPLEGARLAVPGSNIGAAVEPGEPLHGAGAGSHSVWWTWTAPSSGRVLVDLRGASFLPLIAVYRGEELGALSRVSATTVSRPVVFGAVEGLTYHIAVASNLPLAGEFTLELARDDGPPNDAFAARSILAPGGEATAGALYGATSDAGEFALTGLNDPAVWWSWRPDADSRAILSAVSEAGGLHVRLFRGSALGSLTPVGAGRSLVAGEEAVLVFNAAAGVDYAIAVLGSATSEERSLRLGLELVTPPPNDDFANRLVLPRAGGESVVLSRGARSQPGEPLHASSEGGPGASVWWSWRPPSTAAFEITTEGSDFATSLAVYTGSTLAALRRVTGGATVAPGSFSRVAFLADENLTYQIAVTGNRQSSGTVRLAVRPLSRPIVRRLGATGPVTAGTEVVLSPDFAASVDARYQWTFNGVDLPGATEPGFVLPAAQLFHAGGYAVRATGYFGTLLSEPFALAIDPAPPSTSRLLNLSTRALGRPGDGAIIPGFVLAGPGSKRLLLRAVGPELARFGVADPLSDPSLSLKRSLPEGTIDLADNDDWGRAPDPAGIIAAAARLGAFPLTDGGRDAALLVDLPAGAYTVVTSNAEPRPGVGIVELYDADEMAPTTRVVNLSNRGFAGGGAEVMIPGFVVSSEGPRTLLLRAVGPTLAAFGVDQPLADPALTLFQRTPGRFDDRVVLRADDWGELGDVERIEETAREVGAFPLPPGSRDAAVVVTLPAGVYTVHAGGVGGLTGIVLVEVYVVP